MCIYVCWDVGGVGESYHIFHIFLWIWEREKSPCAPPSLPQGSLLKDLAQLRLCSQMATACFPHNPCPNPVCTPQPSG